MKQRERERNRSALSCKSLAAAFPLRHRPSGWWPSTELLRSDLSQLTARFSQLLDRLCEVERPLDEGRGPALLTA
eukprot:4122899-Amphidinium_carterae.1